MKIHHRLVYIDRGLCEKVHLEPHFDIHHIYLKLVDCLEKCLIYGHIRRFAN